MKPATWNVYMVMEDGESRIYAAPSMARAVEAAWQQNLAEVTADKGHALDEQEAYDERRQWEDAVLQSCTLVGELENLEDLRLRSAPPPAVPSGVRLVDRLHDAARALYHGDSLETGRDPIACILEAADELEVRANRKEPK